ncbi:MAG: hypothetical protein LBH16_10075 [Treponema sp.]|jgi:hypothetical protein|nr:hypothetical protein [Treponema sp.]
MKGQIVFLPVPENFKNQYNASDGTFPIDPNIPIPAELPDKNQEAALSGLNMEMIISGMLRVIEEKLVKQEWIDYYSGFVLFMRPDILEICQSFEDRKNNNREPNEPSRTRAAVS